jgi:ribosomal protein S18 acetylase RimI-like enzyme
VDAIAIRRMSDADLDAACVVVGLAFADNPSTLANVRGDRQRARLVMQRAVRIAKLGRQLSHVLVAEDNGQLVGVLNAVEWPHCQLGAAEKLKTAPAMIRATGSALPNAFKMMNARARHDPREPHWHVGPVGVHPDHQGHGVGKTLLTSFAEMIDERGESAFLETDVDRNVALYERFGFRVTGQADIIGVNTRFMWRDARPVS